MTSAIKPKIPLLFLIAMSAWWGFYYQSNSSLNDYGAANFEWLFLLDGLLVLPVLCFICIDDKKQAAIKAALYSCLIVLIGSFIIPEPSKLIWPYLESGRYLVLAGFFIIEVIALLTVYIAIRVALTKRQDPDVAIASPIQHFVGNGITASVLAFETRMWTYALFGKSISFAQFGGQQHFSYHNKDGAQSNAMGFILLMLLEIPLLHIVLHFSWSAIAANIITVVSLFGLVFMVAENRAMSRRPISLGNNELIIRYGIFNPRIVALNNIASITRSQGYVARTKNSKRYNYTGEPNVVISLITPEQGIERIYLGMDNPTQFINAVNEYRQR